MARKNKKICFENIEVIDAGAKGKSVAKAPDGKIIFLSNAIPGDVIDIQTFKKRKAYYEGKAIKFHKFSEKRTTPKCEHFGTCGGCKWQHMEYEHQLFYKQNEVLKEFDHEFYNEKYEGLEDFYQPHCKENGISEKERLFFGGIIFFPFLDL